MDLHTVIDNLHRGKRAVTNKELKTIVDMSEITSEDSHVVGNFYSNLARFSSVINKHKDTYNLKSINCQKQGFIVTHQGILMLLEDQHILKNITTLLSNSHSSTIVEISDSIHKILKGIDISELLQVQLSRNIDYFVKEHSAQSFNVRLSFSTNDNSHISLNEHLLQIPSILIRSKDELNLALKSLLLQFYSQEHMMLRNSMNIKEQDITLAFGVEVNREVLSSGVCISSEFESNHHNIMNIYSTAKNKQHLLENMSSYDRFEIYKNKDLILNNSLPIISKTLHSQKNTEHKKVSSSSLNDSQLQQLSKLVLLLEEYYNKIFFTQTHVYVYFSYISKSKNKNTKTANPLLSIEHVVIKQSINSLNDNHSTQDNSSIQDYEHINYYLTSSTTELKTSLITKGIGIANTIIHGNLKWIKSNQDVYTITSSDIVVITSLKLHWIQYIKKARGVICEYDDEYSLLAQICYNEQIPAILHTKDMHHKLKNSQAITIDTTQHEGVVYEGVKSYKIEKLSKKQFQEENTISHTKQHYNIIQHLDKNHVLLKSHLPSQGLIINNLFDVINTKLKSSIHSKEDLVSTLVSELSKIVISNQPHTTYINIDSFSHFVFSKLYSNESYYKELINTTGIERVLNSNFKPILQIIIMIIERVEKITQINSIELFTTQVQEAESLKKLKIEVSKLSKQKSMKIGAVCGVGGIILLSEIEQYASFVACDLNEVKQVCGVNNIKAQERLIHTFLSSKSSNKHSSRGLFNVDTTNEQLLHQIMLEPLKFITCNSSQILYHYSLRNSLVQHSKTSSKQYKAGVKFKSNASEK
ncbi:MAG: PEP/pyruvate-binding domain-containing protein [Candidatus Nanoarchaeia archaeon]